MTSGPGPWGLSAQGRGRPQSSVRILTGSAGRPWVSSLFPRRVTHVDQSSHVPETLKTSEGMLGLTALPGPSRYEPSPAGLSVPARVTTWRSVLGPHSSVFLLTPISSVKGSLKLAAAWKTRVFSLLQTQQRMVCIPGVV